MSNAKGLILTCAGAASALAMAACGDADRRVGPVDDERASAATIELAVQPNRFWYHTDQPVRLAATVEDREGRFLADAEISWSVDPEGAASVSGEAILGSQDFQLHREGRVLITACVAKEDGSPSQLCDTAALRVDDGSPILEISEPHPGAELDDEDGILVRGSVTDASDARVYVLGRLAEVNELGEFEMRLAALPGINHLDVVASDGLTPDAVVEMDVLWAPAFLAANATGEDPLELADGLAFSLGQRLFDREGSGSSTTAEDIAGLISLVASNLPIDDLIPSPVIEGPTFTLEIPSAELGPSVVSVEVTGEGLELFLRFPELTLATEGFFQFDETNLDLEGVVTASVAAAATIAVGGGDGEPVSIEVVDPWVAVESARGEFASEQTTAVFRLADTLLRSMIEQQLENSVGEITQETLPALLGDALGLLDDLLETRELELDIDMLAAPIGLSFGGELGALHATRALELAAALEVRLGVTTDIIHPGSRGVALVASDLEAPPRFSDEGALQLGVRLSLVNGAMHALWSAGLLEIDLHALLPDSLSGLLEGGWVSGKLPPVVRAPRLGEEGAVVLSLGQVELDLDLGAEGEARFGASLEVALGLDIDGERVAIATPGDPTIRVWTIEPATGTVFTAELVAATLRDQFGQLEEALLGSLAFDIPAIAIGEQLAELAPGLADLKLVPTIDETLRVRGDFLMIGAGFQAGFEALAQPVLARLAR